LDASPFRGKTNGGRNPLTYHKDIRRWTDLNDDHVALQNVARGQEFLLDADQYPEAKSWAVSLVENNCEKFLQEISTESEQALLSYSKDE
jgi:hypothetical protein